MILAQFAPFLFVLSIYAACIRLSVRILKRGSIPWRYCFLFMLIVGALVIASRVLSFYSGIVLPFLLNFTAALAAQIVLGGWLFGSVGVTPSGEALGWSGGALVSAFALVLLIVTSGVLVGMLLGIAHVAQP